MSKYPCLILDHDDTVVQSEKTINYPYFCYILDKFRPGKTITWAEYVNGCYQFGFTEMCRQKYSFTDEELAEEYRGYKEFIHKNIPAPYPGMEEIIRRHKAEGGILCVISHSDMATITRDYKTHFGILPDQIFGWDLPEEKRKPHTYPLECILKKYGLTSSQLLIVDDMKPAWEMARKVNVPVAFAKWGKINCPDICREMEAICDYSFETTEDLEKYLF